MNKNNRSGKRPDRRIPNEPRHVIAPARSRDIIRREERLRIAPKHPGMGRR
jgi:hypothetical protein